MNIKNVFAPKTLIDLGETINVMTRDTMFNLDLQNLLRHTTIVLHLADNSTGCPECVLEDVIVCVDSWEYPTEFIVLRTKKKLSGYLLILGRSWLATADTYISCRQGSMIIANGPSRKNIKIFPLTKPSTDTEDTFWIKEDDEPVLSVLTIDRDLY